MLGELLQGSGKFFQGFEQRILAEVGEGQADVVGVVERLWGKRTAFELCDQFLISHDDGS
jgi:hypothetical protein